MKHHCKAPKEAESYDYGEAINTCYENEEDKLIVENGEYASRVDYCPYCGYEAKVKIIKREHESPNNNITFTLKENSEPVEILRLSKDGFFYKAERIDDIHNVYERFNDWLTKAEQYNETYKKHDKRETFN